MAVAMAYSGNLWMGGITEVMPHYINIHETRRPL
jgi:hypothetical protein